MNDGETNGAQSPGISDEQLQVIGRRYEYLRRKKLYGVDEAKRGHYRKSELPSFVKRCGESFFIAGHPENCSIELELKIRFSARREKNIWQEYGNAVLRLYQAFTTGGKHGSTKRAVGEEGDSPVEFNLSPFEEIGMMGYLMVCTSGVARHSAEEEEKKNRVPSLKGRLESLMELLDLLLYPESFDEAVPPISLTVRTCERERFGSGRLEAELSSSSFELPNSPYEDFVQPKDIANLVFPFYSLISSEVIKDISNRGLTVYCAAEGRESIIRRNGSDGRRLLVTDVEEMGSVISQYRAFRFVPDVDECKVGQSSNKYVITRIPFDLDKPPRMGFRAYAQFVNEFNSWLRDQGFKTKIRITGGKGAHILVEMRVDRIAENYLTPFPRALKFDTWIGRVGIDGGGLISAQATDFVKIAGLAYGCYRKNYLGRNSPITVEMHDVTQRYWNILVDSSRALKGMGVAGLGSIHHRTGGVCMPVKKLPESDELNLKSALGVSCDPSLEFEEFEPKYKSHWIQVVGKNPQLLHEEETKLNENPFSLVNDFFLKYGWIPNKYVEMGSEAFMKRYCWL